MTRAALLASSTDFVNAIAFGPLGKHNDNNTNTTGVPLAPAMTETISAVSMIVTATARTRVPNGSPVRCSQLVAATGRLHVLNLLHDLFQVVAGGVLQRRELDVSLEVHQPQLLADG